MGMHLYGNSDSGHSFKVRSFLQLAQLPHRYQWIDLALPREQRDTDFLAASRYGEVPVLVADGRALCQSNAILIYLAQQSGKFAGRDDEWQTVLEWLSWESNRIGFSLPNLRYSLRWEQQAPEVLAYLRQRTLSDLAYLNHYLQERAFLLDSGPTIADISNSAYLFWLDQAGLALAAYPHLQAWLQRISDLPGWQHPDIALQAPST